MGLSWQVNDERKKKPVFVLSLSTNTRTHNLFKSVFWDSSKVTLYFHLSLHEAVSPTVLLTVLIVLLHGKERFLGQGDVQ